MFYFVAAPFIQNSLAGGTTKVGNKSLFFSGLFRFKALCFPKHARKLTQMKNINKHIAGNSNRESVRLILPDEKLTAVDMRIDGMPYIGVLNRGLHDFAHKDVFGWYLSIIIDYDKTVGERMPDKEDTRKMQTFSDILTEKLSGDPTYPNVLFLGRVTGDGYTEIMWYVNNPDIADRYLKELIVSKEYLFEFDYEMTEDPEWREAAYWLHAFTI